MQVILDGRLFSLVVLVLVAFMLVANESFAAVLLVVVVGDMLIDRVLTGRRIVALGGSAWFLVLFAGRAISMGMGQLYVHVDYLFLFCGFLLALAGASGGCG